ncbi:MAG TPA: hypothetical protein VNI02_12390 [Blastocatellia bacterium]|nr:hypothetical protein [Blastocatellia bacterium]
MKPPKLPSGIDGLSVREGRDKGSVKDKLLYQLSYYPEELRGSRDSNPGPMYFQLHSRPRCLRKESDDKD